MRQTVCQAPEVGISLTPTTDEDKRIPDFAGHEWLDGVIATDGTLVQLQSGATSVDAYIGWPVRPIVPRLPFHLLTGFKGSSKTLKVSDTYSIGWGVGFTAAVNYG